MAGYAFSKAAASCLSCGAHAHQVSVVGVDSAAVPPADAAGPVLDDPVPPEAGELELEPLEQAASPPTMARPAAVPAMALVSLELGTIRIVAPSSF
jgi:hypothetical protein